MLYAVGGDAGAIVGHGDVGLALTRCSTNLDMSIIASFERLRCIAHEVDERERQQMRVGIEAHACGCVEFESAVSLLNAQ